MASLACVTQQNPATGKRLKKKINQNLQLTFLLFLNTVFYFLFLSQKLVSELSDKNTCSLKSFLGGDFPVFSFYLEQRICTSLLLQTSHETGTNEKHGASALLPAPHTCTPVHTIEYHWGLFRKKSTSVSGVIEWWHWLFGFCWGRSHWLPSHRQPWLLLFAHVHLAHDKVILTVPLPGSLHGCWLGPDLRDFRLLLAFWLRWTSEDVSKTLHHIRQHFYFYLQWKLWLAMSLIFL